MLIDIESGRSSGVERNLAKVEVEGSNPFARSKNPTNLLFCLLSFFQKYLILHSYCDTSVTEIKTSIYIDFIMMTNLTD